MGDQSGWNVIAGPSVQVRSGLYLDLENPDPQTILVADIAHALSNLCRYTGHTKHFYSVAQHCCLCADNAAPGEAWAALMHDAAEAYIGDVARPLKGLLPEYRVIESRLEAVIFSKFEVLETPATKRTDREALTTERRDLMPNTPESWAPCEGVSPWLAKIVGWPPERSRDEFMVRVRRHAPKAVRELLEAGDE